jgi:hypothetical protein
VKYDYRDRDTLFRVAVAASTVGCTIGTAVKFRDFTQSIGPDTQISTIFWRAGFALTFLLFTIAGILVLVATRSAQYRESDGDDFASLFGGHDMSSRIIRCSVNGCTKIATLDMTDDGCLSLVNATGWEFGRDETSKWTCPEHSIAPAI